jgi:hypothetical protein
VQRDGEDDTMALVYVPLLMSDAATDPIGGELKLRRPAVDPIPHQEHRFGEVEQSSTADAPPRGSTLAARRPQAREFVALAASY